MELHFEELLSRVTDFIKSEAKTDTIGTAADARAAKKAERRRQAMELRRELGEGLNEAFEELSGIFNEFCELAATAAATRNAAGPAERAMTAALFQRFARDCNLLSPSLQRGAVGIAFTNSTIGSQTKLTYTEFREA